jgi:hypothetical protein
VIFRIRDDNGKKLRKKNKVYKGRDGGQDIDFRDEFIRD